MTYRAKLAQLHKQMTSSLNEYTAIARQIKIMIDKGQFIPQEKLDLQNNCFTSFQNANTEYAAFLQIVNQERNSLDLEYIEP